MLSFFSVPCCLLFCCSNFSLSVFLITFSLVSHSLLFFSICLLVSFIAVDLFLSLCPSCRLSNTAPVFSQFLSAFDSSCLLWGVFCFVYFLFFFTFLIKTWIRNVPWIQSICLYYQLFVLCLVIISFNVVCQFVSCCYRLTFCCFLKYLRVQKQYRSFFFFVRLAI